MFRALLLAAAAVLAAPGLARAQYSGAIPNSGNDSSYYGIGYYTARRSPQEVAREREVDSNYRAALKKIPDRAPSNDPWKSVRQAPAADRHTRPQ